MNNVNVNTPSDWGQYVRMSKCQKSCEQLKLFRFLNSNKSFIEKSPDDTLTQG